MNAHVRRRDAVRHLAFLGGHHRAGIPSGIRVRSHDSWLDNAHCSCCVLPFLCCRMSIACLQSKESDAVRTAMIAVFSPALMLPPTRCSLWLALAHRHRRHRCLSSMWSASPGVIMLLLLPQGLQELFQLPAKSHSVGLCVLRLSGLLLHAGAEDLA